jgi:hypothetical protein
MIVHVKTLTAKDIAIEIENSDTVTTLKLRVQDQERIPPHFQRLIFVGKVLEDAKTLAEYYIQHNSQIFLLVHSRFYC